MVLLFTAVLSGPCKIRLFSTWWPVLSACVFCFLGDIPCCGISGPCSSSVFNFILCYFSLCVQTCVSMYTWVQCRGPRVLQASNASKLELQALTHSWVRLWTQVSVVVEQAFLHTELSSSPWRNIFTATLMKLKISLWVRDAEQSLQFLARGMLTVFLAMGDF